MHIHIRYAKIAAMMNFASCPTPDNSVDYILLMRILVLKTLKNCQKML